ncbi:DUF3080 family protein [Neptunomonas japonica]|uniref:DUF3080 family protein n=1 Tax=Neptunomonas japonica TaxID=417574 RepID=UPI00146C8969|nr:DUF3080 family protein [Neptunomonas japonica]
MHTYIKRVANVLGEEVKDPLPTSLLPALPPQKLRHQATTDIREGMLDVLDFSYCELLPLIASRNSSLGIVAQPSQRLIYEIKFYRKLTKCLSLLEKDPALDSELKARIKNVYAIKTQNLPKVIWNALYTGQEIEVSLALNLPPFPLQESNHSETLRAFHRLHSIINILNRDHSAGQFSIKNVEESYAAIYHNPLGTPLLKSLLLLETTFNEVAATINSRLLRRPFCFPGMQNPQADILKNIFTEYYARQIQPYMSKTHRIGEQWFNLHEMAMKKLPTPENIEPYVAQVFLKDSDNSIWKRYTAARDKHTQAWLTILKQCKLMPTRSN